MQLFDIVSNKITFVNNAPKVFYKLVLRYKTHNAVQNIRSIEEDQPDYDEVTTYKQFSDFKQLDLIIRLTCFRLDGGSYLPVLP